VSLEGATIRGGSLGPEFVREAAVGIATILAGLPSGASSEAAWARRRMVGKTSQRESVREWLNRDTAECTSESDVDGDTAEELDASDLTGVDAHRAAVAAGEHAEWAAALAPVGGRSRAGCASSAGTPAAAAERGGSVQVGLAGDGAAAEGEPHADATCPSDSELEDAALDAACEAGTARWATEALAAAEAETEAAEAAEDAALAAVSVQAWRAPKEPRWLASWRAAKAAFAASAVFAMGSRFADGIYHYMFTYVYKGSDNTHVYTSYETYHMIHKLFVFVCMLSWSSACRARGNATWRLLPLRGCVYGVYMLYWRTRRGSSLFVLVPLLQCSCDDRLA
jgi:hypothetical protein